MRQTQDRCAWRSLPGEVATNQLIQLHARAKRESMRDTADQQHERGLDETQLLAQKWRPTRDLGTRRRKVHR